jgi:hypothetical protein
MIRVGEVSRMDVSLLVFFGDKGLTEGYRAVLVLVHVGPHALLDRSIAWHGMAVKLASSISVHARTTVHKSNRFRCPETPALTII